MNTSSHDSQRDSHFNELTSKSQYMSHPTQAAIQFHILLKKPTTHKQLKTLITKIANGEEVE